MKTGSSIASVPLVLISTDDSILDFWTTVREANRVVLVNGSNIDQLISTVDELLSINYVDSEEFITDEIESAFASAKATDEQTLVSWAVKAPLL